jgi:integrase
MQIEKVFRKDLGKYRWKIDITIDGKRIRRAEFPTKKEARDAIAALLTNSRNQKYGLRGPKPKVTLGQLREGIEQTDSFWIFEEFVNLIGEKAELAKLTRADWQKYLDVLNRRRLKPNSINRYLTVILKALNSAPLRFPDLEDWRAPKAPWRPEASGRSRLLSKEELGRILKALLSDRQPGEKHKTVKHRYTVFDLFRLMLLTGAREGEILNLRQSQVSWDWQTVRIESKKGGGSVRVVPLSESALAILKARIDHAPGFFPKLPPWQLREAAEKAGKYSGVIYGDKVDNGWVIYDLRHVAGTVMENHGIPYSAVSAILGHKRTDQTATYAHAQLETLRKAVDVLEKHCREIDGFICHERQKTPLIATGHKQA